jgi:hypothetical protein
MVSCEEFGSKLSWAYLGIYLAHSPGTTKGNHDNPSQDCRFSGLDLNLLNTIVIEELAHGLKKMPVRGG